MFKNSNTKKFFNLKVRVLLVFTLSFMAGFSCFALPFESPSMLDVSSSEQSASEGESTKDLSDSPQLLRWTYKSKSVSPSRRLVKLLKPAKLERRATFTVACRSPWHIHAIGLSSPKALRTLPLLI